jgi:hypothetical protein
MSSQNQLKKELSKQGTEITRNHIERIVSSYRHIWDIYTELLQNSADAIIEQFGEENIDQGLISLSIETNNRKITITDNGIGLEESEIARILVHGESLKRKRNKSKYGFMGFGFTFVAFQSSFLKIESIKNNLKSSRTYHDLYKFVYEESVLPQSEEENSEMTKQECKQPNSTTITVIFPQEFPDGVIEESLIATFRIAQSPEVFEAVLRTRSIVGMLDPIFDPNKQNFQFDLKIDNKPFEKIKTKYLTVREIVTDSYGSDDIFDRPTEYEEKIKMTESLKLNTKDSERKYLMLDEKIDNIKIGSKRPLEVRFLIYSTHISNIEAYNQRINSLDFQLEQGIWLAISGMPLGICLDKFDDQNYCSYTVIVDIKNKQAGKELDAGRKGISAYRSKQLIDKVKDTLRENKFIQYRQYSMGGYGGRISDPFFNPHQKAAEKMQAKIKYTNILMTQQYFPLIEEQEVISLFVELVANKILKGYFLKFLSSNQVYDAQYEYFLKKSEDVEYSSTNELGIHTSIFNSYGNSLKKDIFVEFKQDLRRLFRDVSNKKKDITHIDILICWDVDFESRKSFQKETGYILKEKITSTNIYYGVTHELTATGRQQPLAIIELKKVLELAYGFKEKQAR